MPAAAAIDVSPLEVHLADARRAFADEAAAAIKAGATVTAVARAGGISRTYLYRLLAEQ